jgi:hypothetical protein
MIQGKNMKNLQRYDCWSKALRYTDNVFKNT